MIEWFGDNLWAAWLSLTFLLAVLELFMLDLMFIMLAVGALAATTVALADGPGWLQVVTGSAAALLMLGAVRPVALKHLRRGPESQLTNVDRMAGMDAQPLETVTPSTGLAEVDGEPWTARTAGDFRIEPGMTAVVDAIDGATVYLKPAPGIEWNEPETRST